MQTFVRFALYPKHSDVFTSIKDWIFIVNQDTTPEWFATDNEKYEQLARKKVGEWATTRIYTEIDGLKLSKGENFHLKDCKNIVLREYACVNKMHDSSQVLAMRDTSQVLKLHDSSQVGLMLENSHTGSILDNFQVKIMKGSSQVISMMGNSQVISMWNNSRVDDVKDTAHCPTRPLDSQSRK